MYAKRLPRSWDIQVRPPRPVQEQIVSRRAAACPHVPVSVSTTIPTHASSIPGIHSHPPVAHLQHQCQSLGFRPLRIALLDSVRELVESNEEVLCGHEIWWYNADLSTNSLVMGTIAACCGHSTHRAPTLLWVRHSLRKCKLVSIDIFLPGFILISLPNRFLDLPFFAPLSRSVAMHIQVSLDEGLT